MAEIASSLQKVDDAELEASIRSSDSAVRAAAAAVAAERRAPVGDAILDSVLRFDQGWNTGELVDPLVSLWSEEAVVTKLIDRSHESRVFVGTLDPALAAQLRDRELSPALKVAIAKLG